MDGACRGMSRSERTLRDGVLHDLRRAGIDVVLQVSGMSPCDADERYEQTSFTPWAAAMGPSAPILNALMGGVAGGALAAAVTRPGGLGMIGDR